jgi:hypothetical protein
MPSIWINLVALGVNVALAIVPATAFAQARTVAGDDIKAGLPQQFADFRLREILGGGSNKDALTEAAVAFQRPGTEVQVRLHVADLINNSEIYDRFIATAGIIQANITKSIDALVRRSGDQMTVNQASTTFGDKTLSQLGIEPPATTTVGSLATRAPGPEKPLTATDLIDHWSVFDKGELQGRFGDVPLARVGSLSNAAIRSEHEAYGLGIDFTPADQRAKETGKFFFMQQQSVGQFSQGLTEETFPDGSYCKLFSERSNDVAGWEIFEPRSKHGVLILGIGGRFGVLVEGVGIDNSKPLKDLFAAVPVTRLVQLATEAARAPR